MTPEPSPSSWFSWEKIAAFIGVLAVVGQLAFWTTGTAFKTDAMALAMTGVNSRLDRLFEKVDTINSSLPVLVERLEAARSQIAEGKGNYGSLESRLRAIENNVEAVHQETQKPRRN